MGWHLGKTERWFQVGGLILSIGSAAAFPYWIYILESPADDSLWPWPGIGFLVTLAVGIALMIPSFRTKDSVGRGTGPAQSIQSGDNSRNYQAGGDMRIGANDDTP